MRGPGALLVLASGRLTPLSRAGLLAGLGALLATLLLFQPVHLAAPRATPAPAYAQVLPRAHPWAEHATLQAGNALLMPGQTGEARSPDTAQPDASPFPEFGPELLNDPTQPLGLPGEAFASRWKDLDEAFPWNEGTPFATLGQTGRRQPLPDGRILSIQIVSDNNEINQVRVFRSGDELIKNHKALKDRALKISHVVELSIGIDSFGIQSNPYFSRRSGDTEWNQAVLDWSRELPWARWLPPGSYRVVIGP